MSAPRKSLVGRTVQLGRAERTRLRCCQATVEILSKQGMDALSYESIAQLAGVTRQLVQGYYPKKMQMVSEAAQLVRKKYQEAVIRDMSRATTPELMFNEYLKASLAWPRRSKKEARFWSSYLHLCSVDLTLRRTNTELVEMGWQRIAGLLQQCASCSQLEANEVLFRARAVQQMLTGGILGLVTETNAKGIRQVENEIRRACLFIAGFEAHLNAEDSPEDKSTQPIKSK